MNEMPMWPGADVKAYQEAVYVAGLQSDSIHLRWFAKNPLEVMQTADGKWRYHDIEGGVHETDDLIAALVIAKDAARIRKLHEERRNDNQQQPG